MKNWKHIFIEDILDFKIIYDSRSVDIIHSNMMGICELYNEYSEKKLVHDGLTFFE